MVVYSQEDKYIDQNIKLLKVENQNFLSVIDTIINYEKKYLYDSVTNSRSYLIDYSIFYDDTTIIITSLYPKDIDTSFLQSLYGVYIHHSHWVFVKKKFNGNFIQSSDVVPYKVQEKKSWMDIDDSQTVWNFFLKKGKLIYQWRKGTSLKENYYKIDIIEEKVDSLPH